MENIFIALLPPWVETGLQPAFYDRESGTVLQLLARMYPKMIELGEGFNKFTTDTANYVNAFTDDINKTVADYIEKFNDLHDYVEDYFDNLDVQEEINNKLDDMAAQGTLQEIIASYLQSNVAWCFDTVADMKLGENLVAGSYAQTLGFHTLNDGGGAIYYITDTGTANEKNIIAVGDLYANLVVNPEELNVKQFGAYGDNDHDDLEAIQACIDFGHTNSYYKIYLPSGYYVVSNAINLYQHMELKGNVKDDTHILKNDNSTDSETSVDAIIILKKTDDYAPRYSERQHINNLWLEGNRTTTYAIYSSTESPRIEIDDVVIQKVITGIKLQAAWVYAMTDIGINPVENGIDIGGLGASTTLNLTNTYVNGGTGIGYKLRGVGYSGLTNVACDNCSGTAYYFEYCNLSIDGFGCECQEASKSVYSAHSTIDINNGTIVVNPTSSGYVCIDNGTSELAMNKVVFHDYGENNDETPGKFLNCRDRGNVKFTNCTIDKKFSTANTYAQNNDNQKFSTTRGDYMVNGNAATCGLGTVNYREDDFITKTNQDFHMGSIIFNNRGSARYSLDGTDRRYKPAHDLGDLIVNQAPALNGIAIFQQISDSRDSEMAGSITAVDISGTTGTITMDTLDLANFSKNRGIKVETNHDIQSSSGGTATITGVDFDTSTLSLSNVSGSFDISDSVTYKGKTNIGNSTFSNIQSIGYGTSDQRPSSPVNGYMYWDTTLGKAIWRVGNKWKDATGTNV